MTSARKQPFKINPLPEVSEEQIYHLRLLKTEYSHPDVFYTDAEERNLLFGHYCIIKARYPQLLDGGVKRKRGYIINLAKTKKAISGHTQALGRVIGYVYSGIVDWGNQSIGTAVEIVHIAKTYQMNHLLEVNRKFIYDNLSLDNVFQVLSYSHGLGLDDVKKICINYAMNNASSFFSAKEAKSIDFDLYQELVGILAEHFSEGKRYEFEEPVITERDPIKKHFKSLYNARDESGDISIVMGDKSTKAHKCILSGHSKPLDELIETSESQNNTITIDREKYPLVSQEAFEEIMKFFYFDKPVLEISGSCRMYKFALENQLMHLSRCIEHVLETQSINNKAVPFALEVSLKQLAHHKNLAKKLQDRTIAYAISHFPDINFSHLAEMDPLIGAVLVKAIQEVINQYINSGAQPHYNDIMEKSINGPSSPDSNSPVTRTTPKTDRKKQKRRRTRSATSRK